MDQRKDYTSLMAPSVVEVLSDTSALLEEGDSLWERFGAAKKAILTELDQVDWENSGLTDQSSVDAEEGVLTAESARDYAHKLLDAAFDDAMLPMEFAETLVRRDGRDLPLGPLLRASRSNLLEVSKLPEDRKIQLYTVIKHRNGLPTEYFVNTEGIPEFIGNPLIIDESSGEPILDWLPGLRECMKSWKQPRRGCPANEFPVWVDDKSISLINYFWDRLTQLLYPEQ